MALEWRDQLSVGNDLIDSDHKYLIEVINQAELGLVAKNLTEVFTALDCLSRYSKTHFAREEAIARAVNYPKADQLNGSHELLLTKLDQAKLDMGATWEDAAGAMLGVFLREWLINHVIREDMLMKPYLKKFSPRFDPR
jgi:hemerythrin